MNALITSCMCRLQMSGSADSATHRKQTQRTPNYRIGLAWQSFPFALALLLLRLEAYRLFVDVEHLNASLLTSGGSARQAARGGAGGSR